MKADAFLSLALLRYFKPFKINSTQKKIIFGTRILFHTIQIFFCNLDNFLLTLIRLVLVFAVVDRDWYQEL